MKVLLNSIIQLLWMGVALVIGITISRCIFDFTLLRSIFGGVFTLLTYFFMMFIPYYIKAFKDPDVQTASNLRMSITRYNLYKQLWNEYQKFMEEHGVNSNESYEKSKEIIKQIPNLNEWRRFGNYMIEKEQKARMDELYKTLNYDNDRETKST